MGCGCSQSQHKVPRSILPFNETAVDLSHFKFQQLIGRGGFAHVYASQRLTDKKELVALKCMPKTAFLFQRRDEKWNVKGVLFTERDIMVETSSPFVVPLLHAFQDSTTVYLVLPLQLGGDMGHYLRKVSLLPEDDVRFYGAELVLGLEALHKAGIVYRDLKPSNVLLGPDGHLMLSDFGLAAFLHADNDWQITGDVGTQGYQAPEIVRKQPYTFAVDYFALGVTLMRLATGRRPYGSKNNFDKPIDLQGSKDAQMGDALADLVLNLCRLDVTQRLGVYKDGDGTLLTDWTPVKNHVFFRNMNWTALQNKTMRAPLADFCLSNSATNLTNFPTSHSLLKPSDNKTRSRRKKATLPLSAEQQQLFKGYEYKCAYPAQDGEKYVHSPERKTTRRRPLVKRDSIWSISKTSTAHGRRTPTRSRSPSANGRRL